MKKFYSISLAFLFLLTGMHFTFAKHYCGGTIAASKISVSGELASCGMEGTEDTCPIAGDHLNSNCCDDQVSVYCVDNIYSPSFSDFKDITQRIIQEFTLPVNETCNSFISNSTLLTSVGPPDNLFSSAVSLTDICVFRN